MDIFRWIYDDRMEALLEEAPRLAYIMHRLPTAAVDNRHAEVDALAAEGLVLARQRKDPWIEVFVRHWRLQSTVFKRLEVKDSLREAVDLVERAHRPDAIGCPQSTCATQDLCAAYGRADGPAYVAERLAASEGTLARIDPSWPCWRCISAEYAGALADAQRHAEALAWMEDNLAQMRRVRPSASRDEYCGTWVECLVGLGRFDEAMTLSRTAKGEGQGEHFVQERAIEQAWIHLKAGRPEAASEALPGVALVRDTPDYFDKWAEVVCGLIEAEARPLEAETLRELLGMARALRESGAVWLAFRVGQRTAQALLAAGWLPAADALLDELAEIATERVKPADSLAEVQRLRAAWQAQRDARPPFDLSDRAAALARFEAEGGSFSERLAALAAWPDSVDTAHAVTGYWDHLGFPVRAEQTLAAHIPHAPAGDPSLVARLGERYADEGRFDALQALVAQRCGPDEAPARQRVGRWLGARAASKQGRMAEAVDLLEALAREEPDRAGVRRQLAIWLKGLDRLAEAQAHLEALIEAGEAPGSVDWDRMVLATRRGDWAAVRASGARLGMTFDEAEGPIDEAWEYVRIRFPDEGPDALYLAGRTGPVTARILQPALPGQRNHEDDLVVFDARPLNPEAQGQEGSVFEYALDAVLAPAGRLIWPVDGAHPGDAAVQAVREALADVDGRLHVLSGESYVLRPAEGAERPGLYGAITAPADVPPGALAARIAPAWGDADMTWLSLLDEAQAPAEVARQQRLAEQLEL